MKSRALFMGAVATIALAGTAEASHFKGWYVGLEGGANWIQDADFKADSTTGFTSSFDTGWAALGTVGYAWSNWRFELELGYRANDIDDIFFQGKRGVVHLTDSGELNEFSQMLNAVYDIPVGSKLTLSLGAGAGGDYIMYKDDVLHQPALALHDNDYVFAWQLIGGLNYALGERTELFVDYRYFNAEDAKFTDVDGLASTHSDDYDTIHKHTVTVGLRYDLYADEEPVAAPAPPPPPPPPPAAPKSFIVFFAFNKCNITAEADNVLGEAASAAKEAGSAAVKIVGHTDTSGSNKYNQKLSECRANAAKTNLVGKGVPESAITATGKGETELMVQTGDGVKEPQNRRATVDLN
jgi:outer membrane protein OmpA-like peptidoglycan-associated protein